MNPVKRSAATLSLLLHVLVLGLLPIVDARAEAAEFSQTLHIEADRATGCAPQHNSLTCEICRTVRTPARTQHATALVLSPATRPEPAALSSIAVPSQLSRRIGLRSRAPPQLHS